MPTYVALLRAVNLAGSASLKMEPLRASLSGAGFQNVRSILQSGNLVLESKLTNRDEVERRIEDQVAKTFGLRTESFARTAAEWRLVVSGNPFVQVAAQDPGLLIVLLLKGAPPTHGWSSLQEGITGPEYLQGGHEHGYIVYPDGSGRSKLTAQRIERALGFRGTGRNWNTVNKLAALLPE
jgi:uncharacterized protein (DUF1697 family)